MMSERDELIQMIWDDAVADRVRDGKDLRNTPVVRPKVEAMADKILAAGYRKPRTITTAAELDALPHGSVIRSSHRHYWVAHKEDGEGGNQGWAAAGTSRIPTDLADWLPATVLHVGGKLDALQDAINAAHERLTAAQHGVFLWKSECPPRVDGKAHCPDCSGIVGETGIVW
jgi:hypothetical protein